MIQKTVVVSFYMDTNGNGKFKVEAIGQKPKRYFESHLQGADDEEKAISAAKQAGYAVPDNAPIGLIDHKSYAILLERW